jgi:hypothetical protein
MATAMIIIIMAMIITIITVIHIVIIIAYMFLAIHLNLVVPGLESSGASAIIVKLVF